MIEVVKMSSFGVIARRRQAEFRRHSQTISDRGRSPSDYLGQSHGHLLALGCEEENFYPTLRGEDGALKFFEERGIPWHWKRNMASSQVACVNFLLPLRDIPRALAAVVRGVDPIQELEDGVRWAAAGCGAQPCRG